MLRLSSEVKVPMGIVNMIEFTRFGWDNGEIISTLDGELG